MTLETWAAKWNIPAEAIADLRVELGALESPACRVPEAEVPEARVQDNVRLAVQQRYGGIAWRNNVGAFIAESGALVRFGLANETKAQNRRTKSSDLIGIRPILITPELVGHTVGQFLALEVKREGWKYTGTAREQAQENYMAIVHSYGGHAQFISSEAQLP